MKFPKRLRYKGRGRALATIYKRGADWYRLYWRARVDGKPCSHFKDFPIYTAARREGEKVVAELAKGKSLALSPGQASDALAAFQRLSGFYQDTGRRVSLLAAISEWAEAAGKLPEGRSLVESIEGYLNTVAVVKRKDLAQAASDFIEARQAKTIARDGKRPQLSQCYAYNVAMWLKEFVGTFPNSAVCDLSKEHLNAYVRQFNGLSVKSRNARRNVVRMFLKWCVRNDYLSPVHRLLEADEMAHEQDEPGEIEFYTPAELQAMLDRANRPPAPPQNGDYRHLLPVLALGGLAGLRVQEILRLTWDEVFRVPGHVEVTAAKSKTRSRRLVEIVPALAQWLEPYQDRTGAVWTKSSDMFHIDFGNLREELEVPTRRNGLRHAFVSFHYALHADEGLTAKEAGNSPAMVHKCYKGLATKKQAAAWFAVAPAKSANVIQLATAPARAQ